MALPETFTQFARTAAEQLRWKKARPLVEDELLTHLCDQRDALMAGGMDETAATAESLRLTGDPYEIGTELDRVHRPKTPKLLFALAALIALAGLAFTALVSFRDYELSYFAVHQSVALLLGTAAMLAAYFLDFTLLGHFALPLAADIVWVLVLGANWFARQLAIVLDPHSYIDGHGYRTVVLRELLQNAKFIGHGGVGPYSAQHLARWEGFGMVDLQDHALTLLVHRCGWLALIALVTLLTALLVLAFRRCRRQKSMLARLVSYSVLLSFTTQAAAYLCCDLTLIPISGGVAFPFFTFGIKAILLNMLQLGFLLSTLRVGSVVRDKDVAAGPVRPRRRLRVSFSWEKA